MICVIRPEDDPAAQQFAVWWGQVELCCPTGVAIQDIGINATRSEVESRISGAKAIFYFGHGTENSLRCYESDGIFLDEENIALARGTIIVALACSSAKQLGQTAPSHGVLGYIGFADELFSPSIYHQEFGEAATAGAIAICEGKDTRSAVEAMRDKFARLEDHFLRGKGSTLEDSWLAAKAARWNLDYLQAHGDLASNVTW